MNNTLLLSVWRALRELRLKKGQHAYIQSEHPCKRACGLEYILARQNLYFSATMPDKVTIIENLEPFKNQNKPSSVIFIEPKLMEKFLCFPTS